MTERDPLLEESNRAAHRVARAVSNRMRAFKRRRAANRSNLAERQLAWEKACDYEDKSVEVYEEIQRRAQGEAEG